MQQIIVDIVYLQALHRVVIHLNGRFERPCGGVEIRQFGSHDVFLAWMTVKSDACRRLGVALTIGWRGVEIVHSMLDGIVYEAVHLLLVDGVLALARRVARHGGQTHHAIAQE